MVSSSSGGGGGSGVGGGSSSSSATVYGRLVPEEQLAALGRGLSVINPNASINSTSSLGNSKCNLDIFPGRKAILRCRAYHVMRLVD